MPLVILPCQPNGAHQTARQRRERDLEDEGPDGQPLVVRVEQAEEALEVGQPRAVPRLDEISRASQATRRVVIVSQLYPAAWDTCKNECLVTDTFGSPRQCKEHERERAGVTSSM